MTRERRAGLLAALSVAAVMLAISAVMTDGATRTTFIVVAVGFVAGIGWMLGTQQQSQDEPNVD